MLCIFKKKKLVGDINASYYKKTSKHASKQMKSGLLKGFGGVLFADQSVAWVFIIHQTSNSCYNSTKIHIYYDLILLRSGGSSKHWTISFWAHTPLSTGTLILIEWVQKNGPRVMCDSEDLKPVNGRRVKLREFDCRDPAPSECISFPIPGSLDLTAC